MTTGAPLPHTPGPIGVFDSGYGGLTILEGIRRRLPQYDYIYLGDNARAPYGPHSFEIVYTFTRQAVIHLFTMGCRLVILGCNTASAKALRTIQQDDLPTLDPTRRVLGVIHPTVEAFGTLTHTRHVGVLATEGTIRSRSYAIETHKLFPDISVTGTACPLWAAIVEAGEADSPGADYFVSKRIKQLLDADPLIDTMVLGCTHYPLLMPAIRRHTPEGVTIVEQAHLVADSLAAYLRRHSDMERTITRHAGCLYLTTESERRFSATAQLFLNRTIDVTHVNLD